ncbi:MAG: hypothetical protein ACYC38_11855 [Eubacteriales bacterium]
MDRTSAPAFTKACDGELKVVQIHPKQAAGVHLTLSTGVSVDIVFRHFHPRFVKYIMGD